MRRNDREITDQEFIDDLLSRAKVMRVGFVDEGKVYIVPVNYGCVRTAAGTALYFHGAKAGRKYELALAKPQVGFELDADYRLVEGATACKYGACYASIVGTGRLSVVDDPQEVLAGLRALMVENVGEQEWEFDPAVVDRTAVFRLDVEELSCKARRA